MSELKLLNEAVRDRINKCSDVGAAQFISSIRPIYGSFSGEIPEHIGTGILLEIAGINYILSAAHVFDHSECASLYFGPNSGLELLEGEIFTTEKVAGKRFNDHFDFAWMKLPTELPLKIKNVKFLAENNFANGQEDPKGRIYLALGYPNSRNEIRFSEKSFIPKYLKYSSTVKQDPVLCNKLNITGSKHLFLNFDSKTSKDSEGNIVGTIKPTGISGGGLIDMGIVSKPENLLPETPCRGKLAGILIENRNEHKALVAVKISVIVDQIKKNNFS